MTKGFWGLLEDMAPSLPEEGFLDWTASVDAIRSYLRSRELECPARIVETALESADQWNPGFPWAVERTDEDLYKFSRRT